MKRIIKRITTAIAVMALLVGPSMAFVATASAAPASGSGAANCDSGVGQGVALTNTDGTCNDVGNTDNSFGGLARKVINIFSIVVGAVSVIMIIVGGFRYVISGGDANGVTGAKNTILYAIVGLVIVLFAQVIVRFVLTNTASSS